MSIRSDKDLLNDILDAIDEVKSFTSGLDRAGFVADNKTIRAVELDFIIIGEAASKIPAVVQVASPEIPWPFMKAMRNRLVHAYFSVDPNILWDTIQNDLPGLATALKSLLGRGP